MSPLGSGHLSREEYDPRNEDLKCDQQLDQDDVYGGMRKLPSLNDYEYDKFDMEPVLEGAAVERMPSEERKENIIITVRSQPQMEGNFKNGFNMALEEASREQRLSRDQASKVDMLEATPRSRSKEHLTPLFDNKQMTVDMIATPTDCM